MIIEVFSIVVFLAVLSREMFQQNKARVYEIIACVFFGMVLEIADSSISHSYWYSQNFYLQILRTPLAIGLTWSVVIYSCMLLSDQFNIPWYKRPFLDALTAVGLDLFIDPIATRLGLWQWAVPINQGWYGVPYGNFVGWILVVFIFSFVLRFIRTLNPKRLLTKIFMLASPLVAYAGLLLGIVIFRIITIIPYVINVPAGITILKSSKDLSTIIDPQIQLWELTVFVIIMVELAHVAISAFARQRDKTVAHFDFFAFFSLAGIYLTFFWAMFTSGIYKEIPFFAAFGVLMFLLHCLLHLFPYWYHGKSVYLFRKVEREVEKEEREMAKLVAENMK